MLHGSHHDVEPATPGLASVMGLELPSSYPPSVSSQALTNHIHDDPRRQADHWNHINFRPNMESFPTNNHPSILPWHSPTQSPGCSEANHIPCHPNSSVDQSMADAWVRLYAIGCRSPAVHHTDAEYWTHPFVPTSSPSELADDGVSDLSASTVASLSLPSSPSLSLADQISEVGSQGTDPELSPQAVEPSDAHPTTTLFSTSPTTHKARNQKAQAWRERNTSKGKTKPRKLHPCDECDTLLSRAYDVLRHKSVRHDPKPVKCAACDGIFKRPDALKRHLRSHCGGGRRRAVKSAPDRM
ncbi:uncharacterized protein EI90DRAFT_3071672 [Cantharellus anzutake]|uniref:uncharacterized protein n=1 Tax=Cantharellus anzutake TaxID=1750568 RepID=UPI001905E38A|nr:uncharacterized protein EI90DRAFT_3071672 [Cantharellus anzutake]KAF8325764.1 hypothetical protein EI90DRAFT_3071672 [Cantharellus anzutake]